jgi:Fur family transcriptional regulator, ferric uptake regulator
VIPQAAPLDSTRDIDRFRDFIRRRGLRVTSERLAVCEEIFVQHGHVDAEAVLAALHQGGHRVSRATVYRNLELLVESGLVRKYHLGQRRFLYEHIHAGFAHDHLVCSSCGRVIEFVSAAIRALQAEICRAHGFSAAGHGLQITGQCRNCSGRSSATREDRRA